MPVTPPGHNLQYFSPANPSKNVVRTVTASVSEYSKEISFNVPDHHKAVIKSCLNELGLVFQECNTENYGTWFSVLGIPEIKLSLDGSHKAPN